MRRLACIAVAAVIAVLAVVAAPAGAETGGVPQFPEFDGIQSFPTIKGPTEPDEFSWLVRMSDDQSLQQVSETEVWVEYEDGVVAIAIRSEAAKDRAGALVPTTLRVSEGDVLTLIVHDREGNPAAGGAPFAYPIVPASSWASDETTPDFIKGPPDEMEIEAERIATERAREGRQVAAATTPPATSPRAVPTCTVPSLRGFGLPAVKKLLRGADCAIGRVHLARGATRGKGKVVRQFRAAGIELAAGARVAIKLG